MYIVLMICCVYIIMIRDSAYVRKEYNGKVLQ